MRILHLLAQRPGYTGSGIYLRSIVKEADLAGYTQAVVCGIPQNEEIDFEIDTEIYPVRFESSELPFPVVGMSDIMPYQSTRYRDLEGDKLEKWKAAFKRQIEKAINTFKPDVILSHHLWLLSAIACRVSADIPVLVISHGTGLRQRAFCEELAEELIPALRTSHKVLALNEEQKERIIKEFGIKADKIKITGSGYNDKVFYPGAKQENAIKKIIYAGKIAKAKGLEELISALNKLESEGEKFELTICGGGSGTEEEKIRNYAAGSGFKVLFTGNINQLELAERFRESDLFVLPSYYEGLPLVLIEALACGLMIVVNDLPGISKWLGNDVCCSGQVILVEMPGLRDIDKPLESEIPAYVNRLGTALKQGLHRCNGIDDSDLDWIRHHSWKAVFQKIEKEMSLIANPIQK